VSLKLFFPLFFLASFSVFADQTSYPIRPDESLTPGSLCSNPDSKRYPEGIPYCSRSVKSALKHEIMQTYDERLGFGVTRMSRAAFKIDHYIPLCMGGSNNSDNLWPQHEAVYVVTDPLEQEACIKMSKGLLRQADAVVMIKQAKADLSQVPHLLAHVRGL
jgi:hypothetical protein